MAAHRLWLAPVLGLALPLSFACLWGPELAGSASAVAPANSPGAASTCGKFGTSVNFVASASEAARRAAREQKLVFVLHVSGLFENPEFT
jgi:hypothetical protein